MRLARVRLRSKMVGEAATIFINHCVLVEPIKCQQPAVFSSIQGLQGFLTYQQTPCIIT